MNMMHISSDAPGMSHKHSEPLLEGRPKARSHKFEEPLPRSRPMACSEAQQSMNDDALSGPEALEFDYSAPFMRISNDSDDLLLMLQTQKIEYALSPKPWYTCVQFENTRIWSATKELNKWGRRNENGVWERKNQDRFRGKKHRH